MQRTQVFHEHGSFETGVCRRMAFSTVAGG
jgi:hypothetical protein